MLQNQRQLSITLATNAKKLARQYSWQKRADRILTALGWGYGKGNTSILYAKS